MILTSSFLTVFSLKERVLFFSFVPRYTRETAFLQDLLLYLEIICHRPHSRPRAENSRLVRFRQVTRISKGNQTKKGQPYTALHVSFPDPLTIEEN